MAAAVVSTIATGYFILRQPSAIRDEPGVVFLLEAMQAHHNEDLRYPIEVQRNQQGQIDEIWFYLDKTRDDFTVRYIFREMTKLPSLEKLVITGSDVNDDDLRWVRNMPSLKSLSVQWSPITDAGLKHLEELPNLQEVGFYSTGVTYERAREFHAKMPHCRFLDSWCCGCMTIEAER
ncbi:MAG: hypothetical protein O2955_01870 [Planctomycetota bacterium]|nr:hypothetical protein [Planctomycetota bacterium]MDA1211231.1 hypothetical protein [Planctomycetota bacterium]